MCRRLDYSLRFNIYAVLAVDLCISNSSEGMDVALRNRDNVHRDRRPGVSRVRARARATDLKFLAGNLAFVPADIYYVDARVCARRNKSPPLPLSLVDDQDRLLRNSVALSNVSRSPFDDSVS